MRIIAGTFRGRTIAALPDLSIRPTTDRAKQTIFDILTNRIDFEGMQVLDLFSGSGSLGLEAISRGAAHVTFVEKSHRSIEALEKNIRSLGVDAQTTIQQADVFWFLKQVGGTFDLVFADPPYALESIGAIPRAIYESGCIAPDTYVVMEYRRGSPIDLSETQYDILTKPFGQTIVLILRSLAPAVPPPTKDLP